MIFISDPISVTPYPARARPVAKHSSRTRVDARENSANRGEFMIQRTVLVLVCAAVLLTVAFTTDVQAQQAYGMQWGNSYSTQDWNRLYHYPYVYYPQNFWGSDYYRSSEDMYHRYPPEMRIPVYNRQWHNYYPQARRYHQGHHFKLDIF